MIEILTIAYPQAKPEDIADFAQPIADCMDRYEINTPLRRVHFLAQVGHESGQLRYREEIASGAAYEGRRDLGNFKAGDGQRFKGRGLIQLTGRDNYTKYDTYRGANRKYVTSPHLVAEEPDTCVDVAGWYWMNRRINTAADKDSILTVTRFVNGGYNGLDDRKRLLRLAKQAYGLEDGEVSEAHHLQRRLRSAGFAVTIDGIIGPKTRRAVLDFQVAHGLQPDGIVGPITMRHLERYG